MLWSRTKISESRMSKNFSDILVRDQMLYLEWVFQYAGVLEMAQNVIAGGVVTWRHFGMAQLQIASKSWSRVKTSRWLTFSDLKFCDGSKFFRIKFLRVVQTKGILFLKSMSDKVGSTIKRLWIGIFNRFWVDLEIHYPILELLYVGSDFFRHWFQK